ncbi:winged helix-turn-helix domain-containing protein [Variovorax paradoxus]|nr:winged helix-turn-helix domain-containing protein [Variovorax paradoxus]MBT2299883.1 winged helix-turn-helix domain-containing protein [Variovorax paradoxus]
MDLTSGMSEVIIGKRLPLGGFVLDLEAGELRTQTGQVTELRKQALDVLCVLGAHANQVVGKDELMRRVWPDVVVGEDSLVQAIADIRRLLNDRGHRLVRTLARRGYMLVPESAASDAGIADTPASLAPVPLGFVAGMQRHWLALAAGGLLLAALAGGLALGLVGVPSSARLDAKAKPPPPGKAISMVVLPLDNAGGSDDDWFVSALTADLTMALGQNVESFVIGRETARSYQGKNADPRVVARELGVRHVLRGGARRDGERVRLSMELIDGESGALRWTQQFEIERAQLASSIDDIVGQIGKTLFVEFGRLSGERVARMKPDEVAADDLAMQGFGIYLRHVGPENIIEARRVFEQAVAKDPNSVRGLAGVSMTNSFGAAMGYLPDKAAATRRSEEALNRMEQIDPNRSLTLLSKAGLVNLRGDWAGLLSVSETLVERFPNEPTSHHQRCTALMKHGRFEDSVPFCQRALRISPRDSRIAIWWGLLGLDQFMLGQYAAAAESAQRSVSANARLPLPQMLLAASLVRDGRKAEGERIVQDWLASHPDFNASGILAIMRDGSPAFVEGRDRLVASAREAGLP